MGIHYKEDLFEFYENETPDTLVAEYEGYMLFKEDLGRKGYLYSVYDPDFVFVTDWRSFDDIEKWKDMKHSPVYTRFLDEVRQDTSGIYNYDEDDRYYNDYPSYTSRGYSRSYDTASSYHRSYPVLLLSEHKDVCCSVKIHCP